MQSVPSSGTACNGEYRGTFPGNVRVSAGWNCVFVDPGSGINGNVQFNGGNLTLIGSRVTGNVQLNGGGAFTIDAASTINGNHQIQNLPSGAATNEVCESTVDGNLQFQNNGTAALIGAAAPVPCPGNTIGGNLQVENNSAAMTVIGNSVRGNVQVSNNMADTAISDNTVNGNLQDDDNGAPTAVFDNMVANNLQCQNNTSITGGGNAARQKQGQFQASEVLHIHVSAMTNLLVQTARRKGLGPQWPFRRALDSDGKIGKSGFDLSDSVRTLCDSFAGKADFSGRHGLTGSRPGVAAESSPEPRQRDAEGVGLEGDAQRQAVISRP